MSVYKQMLSPDWLPAVVGEAVGQWETVEALMVLEIRPFSFSQRQYGVDRGRVKIAVPVLLMFLILFCSHFWIEVVGGDLHAVLGVVWVIFLLLRPGSMGLTPVFDLWSYFWSFCLVLWS